MSRLPDGRSGRGGLVTFLLIAVLALATTVAVGATAARVQRMRQLDAREHRIAGRELALGAACLADGAELVIDGWTVRRSGGALSASGPRGTYAIDGAGERWTPARERR